MYPPLGPTMTLEEKYNTSGFVSLIVPFLGLCILPQPWVQQCPALVTQFLPLFLSQRSCVLGHPIPVIPETLPSLGNPVSSRLSPSSTLFCFLPGSCLWQDCSNDACLPACLDSFACSAPHHFLCLQLPDWFLPLYHL